MQALWAETAHDDLTSAQTAMLPAAEEIGNTPDASSVGRTVIPGLVPVVTKAPRDASAEAQTGAENEEPKFTSAEVLSTGPTQMGTSVIPTPCAEDNVQHGSVVANSALAPAEEAASEPNFAPPAAQPGQCAPHRRRNSGSINMRRGTWFKQFRQQLQWRRQHLR